MATKRVLRLGILPTHDIIGKLVVSYEHCYPFLLSLVYFSSVRLRVSASLSTERRASARPSTYFQNLERAIQDLMKNNPARAAYVYAQLKRLPSKK